MHFSDEISGRRPQLVFGLKFENPIRRPARLLENGSGNVIDRNARGSGSFAGAPMSVPVKNSRHLETIDRFLQTTRAQKRKDLRIFPFNCGADGRVMQKNNFSFGLQSGERLFQTHRVIDRFLNEVFN